MQAKETYLIVSSQIWKQASSAGFWHKLDTC